MIALLDTNAYTAVMRGNNNILAALADAERIMMSCIVVGELDYGFRHGQRYQSNRAQLEEWLAQPFIDFLTVTRDTSTTRRP